MLVNMASPSIQNASVSRIVNETKCTGRNTEYWVLVKPKTVTLVISARNMPQLQTCANQVRNTQLISPCTTHAITRNQQQRQTPNSLHMIF